MDIASKLKSDIPAGLVVFLVALPLCLGVALASGAPLLSGVISGIIGGIVVGLLSHSQTSVSGPAAGLTAIVLASITKLGSFDLFLTAVLIAGALQLIMGLLKTGFIANYIPSNVIKGLLAAIGIILILKQIPHAIGYDADPEEDYSFLQPDGENTFSELVMMLDFIHPGAVIISTISIAILVFWDKTPMKKITFFPASLFVVILGVVLNILFSRMFQGLLIESSHLVNIPPVDTSDLSSYIHLPKLSHFQNYNIFTVAVTIALVASLETLLNIEAVDKVDPHKRESPPNRELLAQGVGNMVAGVLGGIPVTSVIVRSSVNMNAGNKTKFSTILHGLFLLVSILTLAPILNLIPLASLAAILLVTGYKLAKVSLFKDMYAKGWHQFIPFVVTIVAIVLTDLLIGILIGMAISIFFLLRSNFRNPFTLTKETLTIGEVVKLDLSQEVSFLNKASIKAILWQIPENAKVIIDASNSGFIDDDVLEILEDFRTTVAPERQIHLNILGLKEIYKRHDHIQFTNVLDKETQQKLTPEQIVELLQKGNERFMAGDVREKYYSHQINETSSDQNPMAVIVSCIDSRATPEIIFDAGIGDLLIIRIAGNISSKSIIGSLELAVNNIGAKLVVVMGHSNCGAINVAIQKLQEGSIGYITKKINNAISRSGHQHTNIDTKDKKVMEQITRINAENSILEIMKHSPELRDRMQRKEIGIIAAYYDTASGKVHFDRIKENVNVS